MTKPGPNVRLHRDPALQRAFEAIYCCAAGEVRHGTE
jgi:hypothetical protein